ncbi:MAG: molybdopterin cofactor-binding domain-containing protein [Bdellovibrionota bacterium]
MSSSLPHDSALTHVTGQSEYVDDRPKTSNELFVEVVYSTYAHARIKRIDRDAAMRVPTVQGIFTASDFHHNLWGTIFQDQPLLADGVVNYAGEAIAVVAAESREAALNARDRIKVEYEALPAILSIDQARAEKSFIGNSRKIERGGVEQALRKSAHRLEGRIALKGADHFYLESQASIAYPKEDGQIEIHCSTQHPTEVQHVVAHSLGLSSKDVVCIVKRMGGGFGGKESQAVPFAAYAALIAHRLKRPARIVLTKDDDMITTGKRNPFENLYQVGFDKEGRIAALDVELFSDGGAYADLSTSIMERAMLHCDNAYFIPHMRVVGQVCRTHFHPHTAFRGFGGPKGVATIERIIEEIAHFLGKDPLDIRKLNVYSPGRDTTHYGQKVENNHLPALFERLEKESGYRDLRRRVDNHNQKYLKERKDDHIKGLSLTAVKFGISFTTRFLNQANALVVIYRDGSIQISTGATEMGQGVNARIAQLVAEELGLSRDHVRVMPTSTEKNANTSPTAASSGTDLNGAAAVLAARKIKSRLSQLALSLLKIPEKRWARHTAALGTEPEIKVNSTSASGFDDANLDAIWETGLATYNGICFSDGKVFHEKEPSHHLTFSSLVNEAYHHRISLSDYAHFKIPGLTFNKVTGEGNAFLYFTQGVALSEVSVHVHTGEVKVQRVDILMDLGRPINEALDVGQVTGGFIQGMGWLTTENLYYSSAGALLSHSPSTYKIPSIQDTPRTFRVDLISNHENRVNLRGTKAVGEPPLLLAVSVWTAIHDALKHLPHFEKKYPNLRAPATQEEVLRNIYPEKFALWEGIGLGATQRLSSRR